MLFEPELLFALRAQSFLAVKRVEWGQVHFGFEGRPSVVVVIRVRDFRMNA
jgi:hypothetical protein